MLIDDRLPPREPELPAWEPNWRVWRWVAVAFAAGVAAVVTGGALSVLLSFAAFAAGCQALAEAVPVSGLRDWRQ